MKADQIVYRLSEKARAGDCAHSDITGKRFAKLQIGIIAEFVNIKQNVIFRAFISIVAIKPIMKNCFII